MIGRVGTAFWRMAYRPPALNNAEEQRDTPTIYGVAHHVGILAGEEEGASGERAGHSRCQHCAHEADTAALAQYPHKVGEGSTSPVLTAHHQGADLVPQLPAVSITHGHEETRSGRLTKASLVVVVTMPVKVADSIKISSEDALATWVHAGAENRCASSSSGENGAIFCAHPRCSRRSERR